MRLAVLTGHYVGVVVMAHVGTNNDAWRVIGTNAIRVPIDSAVFLFVAFGSLEFIEGQIVVKYAATLLVGVPLVLLLRRYVQPR